MSTERGNDRIMMPHVFTRSNALRNISRHGLKKLEWLSAERTILIHLLTLVLAVEPTWTVLQPHLTALSTYAVAFRYPGSSATKSNAANALKDCRNVRHIIRQSFGLPV